MRATVEPIILSGSTNGLGIKVVQTVTPGTAIHTATSTSGQIDKVYLSVYNGHTVAVELTIQFGGVTSPDNEIKETIQPKAGEVQVVAGRLLRGGLLIKAFASVANVLVISGEIERITVETA